MDLNICTGTLDNVKFSDEYFNVITMWHSLEHMYDPISVLKEIYRILKKDGLTIVGIPNINSIERKVFGKWWIDWDVPRHLCHFSSKTIKMLLRDSNFKSIKIEYSPNINSIVLSLQNFLLDFFPKWQIWIKKFFDPDRNRILNIVLQNLIGYVLAFLHQSGRIVAYGKK